MWDQRQGITSFFILVSVCLVFYILGFYVGRWSSVPAASFGVSTNRPVNNGEMSPAATDSETLPLVAAEPADPEQNASSTASKNTDHSRDNANANSANSANTTITTNGVATTTTNTAATASTAEQQFVVRIAGASSIAEARQLESRLRQAGFEGIEVVAPQVGSVAQFYRVQVGPYNRKTAEQVANELQQEHQLSKVSVVPR
jgi:cell division septation protein DedD